MSNETNYTLTIAIPVYNRKELLLRCLDSIVTEDITGVEIVVFDNASDDGTEQVLKCQSYYSRIQYYRHDSNVGPDANFLACYQAAQGDYVLLLGSDDVMQVGSIQRIIQFLRDNEPLTCVFLNHTFFQKHGGVPLCVDEANKTSLDKRTTGNFSALKRDTVVFNKNEFLSVVRQQMVFMSCIILKTSLVGEIDLFRKYEGTFFLQTYVLFEVMVKGPQRYGIVANCCVAQDLTPGNAPMGAKKHFTIFHRFCKKLLDDGVNNYGFDSDLMAAIYEEGFASRFWRNAMLGRIWGMDGWEEELRRYYKALPNRKASDGLKLFLAIHTPIPILRVVRTISRKRRWQPTSYKAKELGVR